MTTKFKRAHAIVEELSCARELDDEAGERVVRIAKLNDVFLECESIEEHIALADALLTHCPAITAVLLQPVIEVRCIYEQNTATRYNVSNAHSRRTLELWLEQGDELVHVALRALLNFSSSTHCCQQIVTRGGVEALVAILPLSHPLVQVLALRVLLQLTVDDRKRTARLCTRSCLSVLSRLLRPHAAATDSELKEKTLEGDARTTQADGAWRLLVAAVLPLLNVLTSSSRFARLAATCDKHLRDALETTERRMRCASVQQQEHEQVLRILSRTWHSVPIFVRRPLSGPRPKLPPSPPPSSTHTRPLDPRATVRSSSSTIVLQRLLEAVPWAYRNLLSILPRVGNNDIEMMTPHQRNIDEINRLDGFDVIIVCTSTPHQAEYWQDRLMATRGSISPAAAKVIAVFEDWDGGAGNGLGTLYAYTKAVRAGKELYGLDIPALLAAGTISVALYHTAGKGTRLAPLPGSENNNKSGVKLPAMVKVKDLFVPMTILEAVVKQTGVYASSRRGRLSVFWGDQVFIPSADVKYKSEHHIDILAALAPMPTEEEWSEKGLEKYGLIVVNQQDDAAQVDKVTHETAIRLLASFGEMKSVGTSLGSFSVDSDMLEALLTEFKKELAAKEGKFDSDPHFWMPLTLEEAAYTEVMAQKGVEVAVSATHYARMQAMMKTFEATRKHKRGLFGCVDVGSDVYWWDYGQLKLYLKNNRLVTQPGVEADCLRSFLGIKDSLEHSNIGKDVVIKSATVLNCEFAQGSIAHSVLSGVCAREVNAEGSILINVTARTISAPHCVVYNVTCDEAEGLVLEEGAVLVGVLLPNGEKVVMRSNLETCGGEAWKTILEENEHSFESIYELNAHANVSQLEKLIQDQHLKLREVVLA